MTNKKNQNNQVILKIIGKLYRKQINKNNGASSPIE
jgi:hypothetical protein